jgi:hypothetical protein
VAASGSKGSGLRVEVKPSGRVSYSGFLTRGGVAVEACAFCDHGHLTAPGFEAPDGVGRGARCDRWVPGPAPTRAMRRCDGELAYLADYPAAVAAWPLGGPDAAWEVIRVDRWPTSTVQGDRI